MTSRGETLVATHLAMTSRGERCATRLAMAWWGNGGGAGEGAYVQPNVFPASCVIQPPMFREAVAAGEGALQT